MSTTKRMTITEALVELKNYDNKIRKAIAEANFATVRKKSQKTVNGMTVEEFEKRAKASYDSILAMMKNREAIKKEVVLSNATTMVDIDGSLMTVAAAIEKRNLNDNMNFLLGTMNNTIAVNNNSLLQRNADVDAQCEKLLASYYNKDAAKKISSDDYHTIIDPYKEANEWVLVDPIGLQEAYDKLSAETSGFMANVDTALSVSNATTFIEVEMQ